jgi:glycerol-3-phosphate O-acyltransferase
MIALLLYNLILCPVVLHLLRRSCLAETGDLLVVPISINYEEIPEQPSLANEAEGGYRAKLNSQGLLAWLKVRRLRT